MLKKNMRTNFAKKNQRDEFCQNDKLVGEMCILAQFLFLFFPALPITLQIIPTAIFASAPYLSRQTIVSFFFRNELDPSAVSPSHPSPHPQPAAAYHLFASSIIIIIRVLSPTASPQPLSPPPHHPSQFACCYCNWFPSVCWDFYFVEQRPMSRRAW